MAQATRGCGGGPATGDTPHPNFHRILILLCKRVPTSYKCTMDFRAGATNVIQAQRAHHPQKTQFRPGRRRVRLPMKLATHVGLRVRHQALMATRREFINGDWSCL